MNYAQLSRVLLKHGDLDSARHFAEQCVRLGQEIGTTESVAAGLHAVARVDLASGALDAARAALEDALAAFEDVSNPVGSAAVLMDLGRVSLSSGELDAAERLVDRAFEQLEGAPHFSLRVELEKLREEMTDRRESAY